MMPSKLRGTMKTRMTHAARAELADAVRSRYSGASGKAKRRILDEFIAASGYHEKSAIRVLNEPRAAKERQTRKRPSAVRRGIARRAHRAMGGLRPSVWQAFEGAHTHPASRN
jgi:hypothetical protein